jgi:biopolymer transport protein ExbD
MVELPLSTTTSPVPSGMPRVVVSKQAIVLEGDLSSLVALPPPDRWANGVDAQYKRNGPNDLFLVPLGAALARARQGAAAPIAIGFDASIPYRIVVEVLFTAGQSEYAKYHLLTRTAAGFGAIVSEPPKVQDVRLVQPVALNLAVFVVPGGLVVKGAGGSMAPGCKDVGPGITLPRGAGGHDLAGLRACAASLRALDPRFAAETQATITANPDVPFGEIVAVMDALRVDPSGQVGFPDVHFGVAR